MDELTLVRRMKAGDRSAFDKIYEKYHIPILRSAYLLCGDRHDAEDILQETFITCWLHIGELKKEEGFRYWLYRIMTRVARKAAAERRKQVPDENVQQKADDKSNCDNTDRGMNDYDRLLNRTIMEKALVALDAKSREVIVLYYYEEMSVKEIADTLGVFEGTVKSRLYFGRRKLKTRIQNETHEASISNRVKSQIVGDGR